MNANRVLGEKNGKSSCAIAVMGKASSPGRTKTRLSPPLTSTEAAAFNTAFLQDIARKLLQIGRVEPITPYVAYAPTGSEAFFRSILPDGIDLIETCRPNFGQCLLLAITAMLEVGHTAACVLNADSPTLPSAYLVEAARVLARPGDRAVLGPSTDGGYYLLGVKQAHAHLFADIAWSTDAVAEQTRQRALEIGLPLEILPTWYDVDDVDGLRAVIADLQCSVDPERAAEAPDYAAATAELILRLDLDHGLLARLGVSEFSPSCLSGQRVEGVAY